MSSIANRRDTMALKNIEVFVDATPEGEKRATMQLHSPISAVPTLPGFTSYLQSPGASIDYYVVGTAIRAREPRRKRPTTP